MQINKLYSEMHILMNKGPKSNTKQNVYIEEFRGSKETQKIA